MNEAEKHFSYLKEKSAPIAMSIDEILMATESKDKCYNIHSR